MLGQKDGSKKSFGFLRTLGIIAGTVFVIGGCVLLLAIIITALAVVAPRAPFLTVSEFKISKFYLPAYCPSQTDTACCAVGVCDLTLRQPSLFNITFDVGFLIENKNIAGPLYFDALTFTIKYLDETVAIGNFATKFQEPLSSKVWKMTLNWDLTAAGGPNLLKKFVCAMDTAYVNSGDRDAFFSVVASITGLKYYINPYTVGDIINQKTLNFTDSCLGTPDDCRVSSLHKTGLCESDLRIRRYKDVSGSIFKFLASPDNFINKPPKLT
eukprot:gene2975-4985_t